MKRITKGLIGVAAFALVTLAGCTPELTPEEQLTELCTGIVADDPDMTRVLLAEGALNTKQLCSCYGISVVAQGEAQFELHRNALDALYMARLDKGLGAEAAASYIEDKLGSDAASYPFTAAQMDDVGDVLTDVSIQLESDGSCATVEQTP